MEPRREVQQQQKPEQPRREEKPKRFRLIKLEERIAPKRGGQSNGRWECGTVATDCYFSATCSIE